MESIAKQNKVKQCRNSLIELILHALFKSSDFDYFLTNQSCVTVIRVVLCGCLQTLGWFYKMIVSTVVTEQQISALLNILLLMETSGQMHF